MAETRAAAGARPTTAGAATGAGNPRGDQGIAVSRSEPIAAAGVTTGEQFASLMSALMSDVITGSIDPVKANAAVNAGGKLLKVVEMEYKYGPRGASAPIETRTPSIQLFSGSR